MRRFAALLVLAVASPAFALDPKDVFVVANKNVPASREVAEHYLAKRAVPKDNLIVLDLPAGEDISRADYDAKLVAPLRAALKDRKDAAKVILTVYGVPLRVGGKEPTADQKAELEKLKPELDAAKKRADELAKDTAADPKERAAARQTFTRLENRRIALAQQESHAAVDSELMLLWWDNYPLARWVPNPLYFRVPETTRKAAP